MEAQPPNAFLSTIDESITDTLLRDVRAVGRKMVVVMIPPLGNDKELRDWDLWGPLFLCLFLAILLSAKATTDQASLVFSAVFILVWLGSAVVTLNAKFLGGSISFFQTVCVMGYCLAPIGAAAFIALPIGKFWATFVLVTFGWAWSCWASLRFFRGAIQADREAIAVYPVGLFYFFISWMVVVGV